MNCHRHLLLSALATALFGGLATAQTPPPTDAPPWWGVGDDRTLSLFFDFSSLPLTPQVIGGAPGWYVPQNTFAVSTGPLQIIPTLAGHTDVLGLTAGAAPALLALTVDNDPHLNWVKIFYFQFDVFEGAAGSIVESLAQDLQQYDRSSMTWEAVPIGNGWETVTINVELWPQPDDEKIDWSFLSDPNSDIGIDNLYVNSKCVKIDDADEDGRALGAVDQSAFGGPGLDLFAATGADCKAVAVTTNPLTLQRTYWLSALPAGPGLNHRIFRLDQNGAAVGVTPLPFSATTAPIGATDLAVALARPTPLGAYRAVRVYGLVFLATGAIRLVALDLATGALAPNFDVTVAGLTLPPANYGLAYNPSGDAGGGLFVIADPTGVAYEVSATTGQVLGQFAIPPGTHGAGYDHVFGNYYFWSTVPTATSAGPLRTNGAVFSAYDKQATGTRFFGNLQVANPGGANGGLAAGLEVYRRDNGELRLACVAQSSLGNRLYELAGPLKFGRSLHGRTRISGLPFPGSPNFDITLDGLRPRGLFAQLYVGFSNQVSGPTTLPFNLALLGFAESQVVIAPDLHSQPILQSPQGEFRFPMPTLPATFSGSRMFFQWLVFDPTVPNGLAMSSGAKTVIY